MKLVFLIAAMMLLLFVHLAHASHDDSRDWHWQIKEADGNLLFVCSYDGFGVQDCDKSAYFKSHEACAERMKKAMLDMNGYIQGTDGFMIYRHQNGEAKLERAPNWKPDEALKLRWDQVIRECAK